MPATRKVPVVQNGVYLFWDDTQVPANPSAQTVITKLTVHCLGDPAADPTQATILDLEPPEPAPKASLV
jgi:hypothetical protein